MGACPLTRRRLLSIGAAAALGRLAPGQSVNLQHFMLVGHSLMAGTNGSPALSTSQPFGNKTLTGGTTLTNLVCSSVEDPAAGIANQFRSDAGSGYDVVATRAGHSSANYGNSKKGGNQTYYADSITNAQLLPAAAAAAGKTYRYAAMFACFGENDNGTADGATWKADMVQWRADYAADLGNPNLPLFAYQGQYWNQGGSGIAEPWYLGSAGTPNTCVGWWMAMRDNPGSIFVTNPLYIHVGGFSDNIHLVNTSYRIQGELMGKWAKRVLVDGAAFTGLPVRSITRTGAVISCRFWLQSGRSLVIDATTLSDKGVGKGFEVYDWTAGSGLTISSVSVSGDTATITLSSTPTAGHDIALRCAWTGTVGSGGGTSGQPHSNIRNDDPAVGQASGAHLYDWAFTFEEHLPFFWNPPIAAARSVVTL